MSDQPKSTAPYHQLDFDLQQLRPDLRICVRRPLDGGLSGANVFLVDCQIEDEQRLAVLKLVSTKQAVNEERGDLAARNTWLQPFLPDHFIVLGALPDGRRTAFLSSLARDRMDDCLTLTEILDESLVYGTDHILAALGWVYRQEAGRVWGSGQTRPVRECFRAPLIPHLGNEWLDFWRDTDLPGPEVPGLIFEDSAERWPNPVAFLLGDERLWPSPSTDVRVPWLWGHGDLNPQNVLAPSYQRAHARQLVPACPRPEELTKHLSLIDLPFSREVPFTYDAAFLLSWLRLRLLPRFINRTNRDLAVRTISAVVREAGTGQPAYDVPAGGGDFARCAGNLLNQLRMAQPRLAPETSIAYLASLAAAGLWQAIKAISRRDRAARDRPVAISGLVLSALALRQVLGAQAATLPSPDCRLWADPAAEKGPTWSVAAHSLAQRLKRPEGRRDMVLVLGPDWGPFLGLPAEEDLRHIVRKPPAELQEYLRLELAPPVKQRLMALSALPLMAVLDWSVFRATREAVAAGLLRSDHRIVPCLPGQKVEPNWTERHLLPYFHLRGEIAELPTVALAGPDRNASRRKLRKSLEAFARRRQQVPLVCYVGVPVSLLPEIHEFLSETWQNKLEAVFVGETGAACEYVDDWKIEVCNGKLEDLLLVAEDAAIATAAVATAPSTQRSLRVADMALDAEGELISAPGQITSVAVDEEDYHAISRAGHLFLESRTRDTDLNPRAFLVGHRVTFEQVAADVPVDRDNFPAYLELLQVALREKRPQMLLIPHRPGAGASTALRWLAHRAANDLKVPTLVLSQGGNIAFEAIERLHRLVGRSFVVVADPEDVSTDDQQGLHSRCVPQNYRVVFLSSRRSFGTHKSDGSVPELDISLSEREQAILIERLARYCPGLSLGGLMATPYRSLFLLLLTAFRGELVKIDSFVAGLLGQADEQQKFLLATVAFFARCAHRPCAHDFLRLVTDEDDQALVERLRHFDQLLVLREPTGWHCRHVELSTRILKHYLTGVIDGTDNYRWQLSDLAEKLIRRCEGGEPGGDLAAEYIWALLNPQSEAGAFAGLIEGHEGLPDNAARRRVFSAASEQFQEHVNIISHFGKFLCEEENKFAESDHYLFRAYELEESNEAVVHMIGMRYRVEVKVLMQQCDIRSRTTEVQQRIDDLTEMAHQWFARAKEINLGSEYAYTSAIQLDVIRIKDELRRLGVKSSQDRTDSLLDERVSGLMLHADSLVADGQRYISPENRQHFNQARDELHYLRGDLDRAIECFRGHVTQLSGSQRAGTLVRLARLCLERGEARWQAGEHKKAYKDFEEGQRCVGLALEDPARAVDNIMLWYQCARYMPFWHRSHLIERLEQLNGQRSSLDSVFLLMCLYFADAVDTGSPASWREYERKQAESARRSAFLGVRTRIREWLVSENSPGKTGIEYRIYPHHLLVKDGLDESPVALQVAGERRARIMGRVSRVRSATEAYLKIEPMGFELFFRPRVQQGEAFYKSDEGSTMVSSAVAFTYEKPIGYDVRRT